MLTNLFAIYGTDVRQFSTPSTRTQPATSQRIGNGTAVVDLVGVLSREGRYGGTSTDSVRAELRRLAIDSTVSRIILRVNSPGGSSAGSTALYDAVSEVAKVKPIVAVVEDLGASAAYFAIAGATKIVANRSALVGAIGTYAVVEDVSGMADRMGIKVHVIRAGEFKGMGTYGTALTSSQIAELQRITNDINSQFLAAVSEGRKLTGSKLTAVSDGRVHIAADAIKLGLIDSIDTMESVLSSPITPASGANTSRRSANPANDFYSRLAAQKESRGEQFVQTYRSSQK